MSGQLPDFFEATLRPLIQAAGGDIKLEVLEPDRVVYALFGKAAFGTDAALIRERIIEPTTRRFWSKDAAIEYRMRPSLPPAPQ